MIHKTNIFAAPIICGAALALALAAGCDKMATTESPTGFPEDGVVRIAANAGDPLTRADGTSSSEYSGTTLGLFIDYGTNDKYNGSNVKWTKAENAWTPEKQMLWKDDKTGANIYAYAPYVDGSAADAVNFEIPSDQTAGTLTADLVSWAYLNFVPDASKNDFFSNDGKILISFGHRLVKLTFNFEKGNQFASDVTVSEAVLLGTSSKVVLNATKGTVTAASDAASLDIKLHKVEDSQNPTALKYEAVFFPGDGQKAGAKMLQVKMSGGTVLNYVVPSSGLVSGGLKAGSAYEMKMRLGKDKIELAKDGITVGSWTDSGNLPGGEAEVDPNADVWDGKTVTAFSTGDSTNPLGDSESAPILIESAAQLAYLAQQVNAGTSYQGKYFKLTKDLALAEIPWTPIGGYEQIAESKWEERLFEGNFDGGNHTIYGLKVLAEKDGENNSNKRSGLFGLVNNSSNSPKVYIKNLKIIGANVLNENQFSGILCGSAHYVDISGVEVSGNVTANGWCGGLVGYIKDSKISACKARVKVTSTGSAGGLCAESSDLELSGCSVSSSEVVGTYQTGGLLGMIYGKIDVNNCTADASVKGNGVGGLFGVFTNDYSKTRSAKNCTMTGAVTVYKGKGDEYGGGIVGWLYKFCSFENCGFDGTVVKEEGVDANKERVGAAIGKDDVGTCTFTDCWYNADKISDLYKIGGGKDNAVYSGIEAKNLGK